MINFNINKGLLLGSSSSSTRKPEAPLAQSPSAPAPVSSSVGSGPSYVDVDFQACVYEDLPEKIRDKWTRLRCAFPTLVSVAATCPGESSSHRHATYGSRKWGVRKVRGKWEFATKSMAEYPPRLCSLIADILSRPVPGEDLTARTRVAFEFCAGSATLSGSLAEAGFKVFPVDWEGNEHVPHISVITIDLCSDQGLAHAWRLILSALGNPLYIISLLWIAVPCGTFSRAREIPVPQWQKALGAPEPKPLRSDEYPSGLPDLQGSDRTRVLKANRLSEFAASVFAFGRLHNLLCVIENPRGSRLWDLPSIQAAFGPDFRTQVPQGAAAPYKSPSPQPNPCPVSSHADTHVVTREPPCPAAIPDSSSTSTSGVPAISSKVAERVGAFVQPKFSAFGAIIPEFRQHKLVRLSSEADLHEANRLMKRRRLDSGATLAGFCLPPKARILDVVSAPQGVGVSGGPSPVSGESNGLGFAKAGLPWSPQEFFEAAKCIKRHPYDECDDIGDDIKIAVSSIVSLGPKGTEGYRLEELKRWERLRDSLADKEKALHARLQEGPARVLRNANLLLFQQLLKEIDYPDTELINDLVSGFPIVGNIPKSNCFKPQQPSPSLTVDELLKEAKSRRASLMSSLRPGDPVFDQAILEGTRKEFARGTMRGPFSEEEALKKFGPLFLPARRFCIQQGFEESLNSEGVTVEVPKFRLIDDFSESGHNSAASISETIPVDGTDSVVGLIRCWGKFFGHPRTAECLKDGTPLSATPHPSWKSQTSTLVGCLQDMKAAYRQVPRRESQSHFFLVAYWDADVGEPRIAEHFGQPFGASAAVNNFNRLARAIRAVLVWLLWFPLTQYYDDYTVIEPGVVAATSKRLFERAVAILGWNFECKVSPSESFVSLGVQFNVGRVLSHGCLTICNTERRVANLAFELNLIKKEGLLSPARAASLRGKLGFAFSQTFGKVGRAGLRPLTDRQYSPGGTKTLTPQLLLSFEFWNSLLNSAIPRTLNFDLGTLPPVLVFTDGWQSESSDLKLGIGAVLFDPSDNALLFFGALVDMSIVAYWSGGGEKEMMIHQAELFPVFLSRTTWSSRLWRRRNLTFVDNDGARDCLIKGYSAVEPSGHILGAVGIAENRLESDSWYTRVPSEGNIADGPSRLEFDEIRALGGKECDIVFPSNWRVDRAPTFGIHWHWVVPGAPCEEQSGQRQGKRFPSASLSPSPS